MTGSTPVQVGDRARIEEAVHQYLIRFKFWRPGDFRLEPRGLTKGESHAVVWAVHREDETAVSPGGGKSVELHVDRKDYQVVRELRFQ